MIPKEYKRLVTGLKIKTEKRQITWKEGAHDQEFWVGVNNYKIVLARSIAYDSDGESNYLITFTLLNDNDDTIDAFSVSAYSSDYDEINELFNIARRNAYRIDEALQKLEKALDIDNIVGADNADDDLPF